MYINCHHYNEQKGWKRPQSRLFLTLFSLRSRFAQFRDSVELKNNASRVYFQDFFLSKEVFLARHGVLHVFTSSKAECLEFDKLLQICYTELATDFETLTDILFLMSNFFSKVRQTSHKPDEIYGVIERLAPGTRKIGENSSSLHVCKKIQTY